MPETFRRQWADRLDKFCAITGAIIPAGLIIGKVGFEAVVGLVGVCWITRSVLAGDNPFRWLSKHPLVLPWIIWFACILVSLLVNGAGNKGWAHDVVFLRFVLYGVALLDISRRLPVATYLFWGLAGGVAWAAINMLSAHVIGYDLLGKPLVRYTAKLKEAGRIMVLTAYAAPFFLAEGFFDDRLTRKRKWLFILTGLTAFALLLLTQGRTPIIAALAGLGFSAAFFVRQRLSRPLVISMIVVMLVIGGSLAVFLRDERMWELHDFYDRFYYWKVSWRIWIEHPVFGVGVSSFQDAYREMAASGAVKPFVAPDGSVFKLAEVTHAHNLALMLLSSTGLLGCLSFFWLFVVGIRCAFAPMIPCRAGLMMWPVVFWVIGLTGFNVFNSEYHALLAFFLVMIGSRLPEIEGDPHA